MNSHELVEIDRQVERTGTPVRFAFAHSGFTIKAVGNGAFEHGDLDQAGQNQIVRSEKGNALLP